MRKTAFILISDARVYGARDLATGFEVKEKFIVAVRSFFYTIYYSFTSWSISFDTLHAHAVVIPFLLPSN